MTRLYLLRHGIAVPHGTPGVAEDDRPLTPKGEKHMRDVAQGLRRLRLEIDRIVTSPLPRALKTAEIVADILHLTDVLEESDALRADRSADSIRTWVHGRPETNLMLVGHNPSLTELIPLLISGEPTLPPCELAKGGIAALASTPSTGMQLEWLARPRLFRRLA